MVSGSRSLLGYAVCLALACLVSAMVAYPVFGQEDRAATTATLVGAGDIARCDSKGDSQTANLVKRVPGTVFTLGDNVQVDGRAVEYRNCYDPTWGAFKNRTRPAAGNHDYYTANGANYYDYFGNAAGASGRGYYSYKRAGWLVVVLNSNCDAVGCGYNSQQAEWLRDTLAANKTRCTVAMFHHPLFSTNAPTPAVKPLWRVLYSRNADVILNGHAHSYERFAPQDPDGQRDGQRGIRQFVVGTGGTKPINPFGPRPENSVVRNDRTFGVLRLKLKQGSYGWKFLPVAGKTFTDSGRASCH